MKFSSVLFAVLSVTIFFSCKAREDQNELASNVGKKKPTTNGAYLNFYYEKSVDGDGSEWTVPQGMYLDWTKVKIFPTGDRQARLVVSKLQSIKANGAHALKDIKNATTLDLEESDARLNRIPLELISNHIDLFKEADALTLKTVTMEGRIYYNQSKLVPGGSHVGYYHLTFNPSDLTKLDKVFGLSDSQGFNQGHGIKSTDATLFDALRVESR